MIGTVSSLDPKGFGVIKAQDGSKVPFLFADVCSRSSLLVGQRVVFSVRTRIQEYKAFAENVTDVAVRNARQPRK
jgi:cold shock CspA family protein